jgi:DNA polymerase-3 subunit gamma/tau
VAVAAESGGVSAEAAQRAVCEALNAGKQGSAADAMEDAAWRIAGTEAQVQTELSKTMLPVVMNAEAEKIAKLALRGLGIVKLTLLPGAAGAPGGEKKPKAARSGSAQAKALEHPMVQEAQRLFGAEIQTVIDLRER